MNKTIVLIVVSALFMMALSQRSLIPRVPPGGTVWQYSNFQNISDFSNMNKAVRAKFPSQLKGARVIAVGTQVVQGLMYTIRYQKGRNFYEVKYWSRPWLGPAQITIKQISGDTITPTNPTTPSTSSSGGIPGSTLNGAYNKGNYIWGGAMNLAWNELVDSFNARSPLDLSVNNTWGKQEAANFNARPFSTNDLSSDSYYVKSGYGQSTVDQINREVKQKFPQKSFSDLSVQLNPKDIISYAYFIKQVQYLIPFDLQKTNFFFNPKSGSPAKVQAFKANSYQQRSNIDVFNYINDDDFVLKMKLKQANDELYIIKGNNNKLPQEIAQLVSGASQNGALSSEDKFAMPIVDLDVERKYSELIGSPVVSGKLKNYFIGDMFEKIKFRIDQVGAKVENEAVMISVLSMPIAPPIVRNFILDKPFWVVLKQKGTRPYFITQINTADFMKKL